MAPKRKPPVEETVPAFSDEEETSSGSEGEAGGGEEAEENEAEEESGSSAEEEEEEDEEEEEPKRPTPPPAKPPKTETLPKKQVQKKPQPEPEPVTDSESESDSEQANFTVKPIASKPMENAKPIPKPQASSPPAKQTPAKRGSQVESDSKETKRLKKKDVEHSDAPEQPEDATKTNLFHRVWSDADEIHVLEGLIRFKEERGIDPTKNMDSFFAYIKKNLNVAVTLSQLKDKVARVKRKYQKHKGKIIQKPHERQAFDLWERIWGDIVENGAVKTNGNTGKSGSKKGKVEALKRDLQLDVKEDGGGDKKEVDIKGAGSKEVDIKGAGLKEVDIKGSALKEVDIKGSGSKEVDIKGLGLKEVPNYGNLSILDVTEMEEYVMKRGLDFVEPEERAKMQEEWKKLDIERLKFLVKKNELVNKQAEMILAAYEAGKS